MREQGDGTRYLQAAALLPPHLRRQAGQVDKADQAAAEELRLRSGWPMTVVCPRGEFQAPGEEPVTPEDLALVLEIATRASAHTALERLRDGFFTVQGGHRIGICGSAVVKEGAVYNLRQLSSLAIRIAHEVPGAAAGVVDRLWEGERFQSTLILSPPGGGKTTLLRDLIRRLSDGEGHPPLRVGVADERGELAALWNGVPQLQVGRHTDVVDPQVLAADEITAPEDCAALLAAANCGVSLVCTAHAADLADLERRPLYRPLLENHCFQKLVVLTRGETGRECRVSGL